MDRKRALLIIFVGVLAGFAAMLAAGRHAGKQGEAKKEEWPKLANVVVVKREVLAGDKLDGRNLKVMSWPAYSIPASAIRRIGDAEGRIVIAALVPEEPVLTTKLAPVGAVPGLSALIQSGMRAVTVKINAMVGVDGFIVSGSLVDVLVTMDLARAKDATQTITKTILQNIRVLAVDRAVDEQRNKGTKGRQVSYATLLVNPHQSEQLALAAMRGEILLSLRNNLDQKPIVTEGVNPMELVRKANEKASPPLSHSPKKVELIRGTSRSYP